MPLTIKGNELMFKFRNDQTVYVECFEGVYNVQHYNEFDEPTPFITDNVEVLIQKLYNVMIAETSTICTCCFSRDVFIGPNDEAKCLHCGAYFNRTDGWRYVQE